MDNRTTVDTALPALPVLPLVEAVVWVGIDNKNGTVKNVYPYEKKKTQPAESAGCVFFRAFMTAQSLHPAQ